jgi:hypothetical protein
MPLFPNTNDEIAQYFLKRNDSPLHITGNKEDHPQKETISLSSLKSVLLYEPEEMIISVQSGISLDALQKALAEKGQWIPTLVAEESSEQTLGAAVATDHFHPRSKNCGMLRTTILGGTFCTTSGEVFKSGSRVVKSVAGYDIHRAFCGSRGKFGIILDLTLKVQPKPEMFFHFFAPLTESDILLRLHPTCLEEYDEKLLVEFCGYREDIENDIQEVKPIVFAELNNEEWCNHVKKLITLRSKEKSLSSDVESLLKEVRKVFDSKGVLS